MGKEGRYPRAYFFSIGFDASNQMLQEVVELENLVGSSRDIRPLGKGGRVGSVGCGAHAIVIQRIER